MRSGKEARMSQSELLSDRSAVTERLLFREFSHRINDELASVIRLISVAASRCESDQVRGALTEVQGRLQGYAGIQRSLQMPEYSTAVDLAAYLQQLCRAISGSRLAGEGIELLLSVCPLRINSERCWLLGVIVFELIVNTSLHAFPDNGGSIRLEIWPVAGSIECHITDNGTSGEDPLPGRLVSIIEALAGGLQGAVDFQSGPNGNSIIVKFPTGA
jgi:two-component sensor histidine kinase